jgi:hypothetical protein
MATIMCIIQLESPCIYEHKMLCKMIIEIIVKYMNMKYSKLHIHFKHVCVIILLIHYSAQFSHAIGTYKMHPYNQMFPR